MERCASGTSATAKGERHTRTPATASQIAAARSGFTDRGARRAAIAAPIPRPPRNAADTTASASADVPTPRPSARNAFMNVVWTASSASSRDPS